MSEDSAYARRSIDRIFKTMPREEQQEAWLEMSIVMEGYAQKASARYELVSSTDYLEEAKELRKNWGKMQGLSTGYPSLDRLTKGLVNGELIVIGGKTSNGKTSLAVNITAQLLKTGHRVLFVTMEMTRQQLTSRLLFVDDTFEENAANLVYQKNEAFDWKDVDKLIKHAKAELDINLVVIDHLHHFTREVKNVAEDLGRITKEFQKNAHIHQVPIILISHTRKGEGTSSDDLRGSSYIAQDADIVLMVNRKEEMPDKISISIQKNRNRGYDFNDNEVIMVFHKTKILEDDGLPMFDT